MRHAPVLSIALALAVAVAASAQELEPIKPIARRLPPVGIELPADVIGPLLQRLESLEVRLDKVASGAAGRPDAAVFLKAVRYAIELREFYDKKDIAKAERALDEAERRIAAVEKGEVPWHDVRGKTFVLGHVSEIDGSVQPLGVTVPEGLDLSKPVPLHIFLHGRGDKTTDLHFIDHLEAGRCVWKSDKAIVLEPFGRQCIGWKGPGEVDVFEAIERVKQLFKIDDDRIALIGFSMGGAGAWSIGSHYADRFCIVCPGAGFAETREYLRLKDDQLPNEIEQKLWGVNDAPAYVRNLFNTKVVAYSGEIDKQKQAADRMARAFKEEGRELHHIIGPDTAHKYHPDSLKELHRRVDEAVVKGRDPKPDRVFLQTRTLRYNRMNWVRLLEMREQWSDTRIDAEWTMRQSLVIRTKNVAAFSVRLPENVEGVTVNIDGADVSLRPNAAYPPTIRDDDPGYRLMLENRPEPAGHLGFVRVDGTWISGSLRALGVRKFGQMQGPIDDAFNEPFLIVLPSQKSKRRRVERWVKFESNQMIERWRALFRGDPRVKHDDEVTDADIARYHLVLWGDTTSNRLIERIRGKLGVVWDTDRIIVPGQAYHSESHLPVLIQPNPLNPFRYIVLNSGPTFREAHDRTNSLQNPKLGDWAIVDVSVDPNDETPGRVVDHGFFGEDWRLHAGGDGRADGAKK